MSYVFFCLLYGILYTEPTSIVWYTWAGHKQKYLVWSLKSAFIGYDVWNIL